MLLPNNSVKNGQLGVGHNPTDLNDVQNRMFSAGSKNARFFMTKLLMAAR